MKPIYLDYHATTPCDPRVREAMLPYFCETFGNAASSTHPFGWEAADAVQEAREQVASLLGVTAKEVVFTSGGTESNNLALLGAALFAGGLYWTFDIAPEAELSRAGTLSVGWLAGLAGVGFFSFAVYRLFERLAGDQDDLKR